MPSASPATWRPLTPPCGSAGARPRRPPALGRWPVTGDFRLVDLVDLLLVEEHLGVALVHLAAYEDVEEVRVDVLVLFHPPEDLERLGEGLALLVRLVL